GPLSDVYSLGAVLYAALTGRPPFQAAAAEMTILQVLNQEPLPPRQFSAVPRDLETICLKCLQKEAHKRYSSAQALAEDLRRFLNNEPIIARPVSRLERAWRWVRNYPVIAGLVAAVALLLVAVAVIGVYAAVQFQAKYEAEANARTALESKLYANRIA